MFRSLFFAIGIFLLIFGAQTLVVDKWIMSYESPQASLQTVQNNGNSAPYRTAGFARNGIRYSSSGYNANSNYYSRQGSYSALKPVYQTKEWMPWSLLAAGTVIVLYSVSTGRNSSE